MHIRYIIFEEIELPIQQVVMDWRTADYCCIIQLEFTIEKLLK